MSPARFVLNQTSFVALTHAILSGPRLQFPWNFPKPQGHGQRGQPWRCGQGVLVLASMERTSQRLPVKTPLILDEPTSCPDPQCRPHQSSLQLHPEGCGSLTSPGGAS